MDARVTEFQCIMPMANIPSVMSGIPYRMNGAAKLPSINR